MDDDVMLGDAREWLRERVEDGAICPCCKQYARIYERKVTSAAARTMIAMYREFGTDWVHVPTMLQDKLPTVATAGGYATLGHHWNLIEAYPERRDDGGKKGTWKLTERGTRYVRNDLLIPKHVRLYNDTVLSYFGELVDVMHALGTKFDYQELMAGR